MPLTTIMIGKALATVTENEILTSGMINAKIKFEFSEDWTSNISKTAIFTAGDVTKVVLDSYWENNVCSIPQECLAKSDEILMVGIYGADNANVVAIPTVWATVGKIRKGYEGYEDVSTGTLPIWAQVQSAAAQSATAAKNAQDAAEAAQGKAEDAQAAAEAAQAKAETAQSKAETAQSKAETAQGKAESAQSAAESAAASASGSASAAASSASAAAASETASAQSAQTAGEKASAAQAAAQTAQSAKADAESAKAAAVTAGASAESANASAQSAKSDAESAKAAAQAAQSKAETANTSAQTAKADAEAANTSAQSAKTAAESAKSAAAGSAQSAGASAQSAQASGKLSESWAVGGTGTRTGEDTNNAKYWSEQAQNAAGGGVSSFNGRSGVVTPQTGDYTAAMVGADAQGAAETVQGNLNTHAENTVKHITAEERTAWNAKLASGVLIVTITDNNGTLSADKSYNDIENAILDGIPVLVDYGGTGLPLITAAADAKYFGTIECANDDYGAMVGTNIIEITSNGEVNDVSAVVETLPNPNAITFTGAVTGSYDGSAPMTVNIPSAVTDAHINSLIDTKLGVIENGSY